MNTDKLYEEYEKEVNTQSNGLIKTDKAEFLKMIALYNVVQREQIKEMQKYYVKYPMI